MDDTLYVLNFDEIYESTAIRRDGSFGKSLDIIECSSIYTRNAFTLRCLMFTFVSADAHGARVLHVRIKILRVREANV